MSDDPDHTRRWLVSASGAAILSNALSERAVLFEGAGAPAAKRRKTPTNP